MYSDLGRPQQKGKNSGLISCQEVGLPGHLTISTHQTFARIDSCSRSYNLVACHFHISPGIRITTRQDADLRRHLQRHEDLSWQGSFVPKARSKVDQMFFYVTRHPAFFSTDIFSVFRASSTFEATARSSVSKMAKPNHFSSSARILAE
jgi:hypothetical protein